MQETVPRSQQAFDPLDMSNYRIEKLPKRRKSPIEKVLAMLGPPLALIAFVYFGFFADLAFLRNFDPSDIVSETAQKALDKNGVEAFVRNNHLMLAIFIASIILWITEAIPN